MSVERLKSLKTASIPDWLHKNWSESSQTESIRQAAWDAFVCGGLPTAKDENWKYANLSFLQKATFILPTLDNIAIDRNHPLMISRRFADDKSILLVLVNGHFVNALSDIDKLPKGAIVSTLQEGFRDHPSLIQLGDTTDLGSLPFVSLNEAMWKEGLFLFFPNQCTPEYPIHLLSIVTDSEPVILHTRHIVVLGEQSQVTLLEEHIALTQAEYIKNSVTNIVIGKEAKLQHYKIQQDGNKAAHIAHTFVKQKQNSETCFTHFSFGGAFARDNVIVKLEEQGASCKTAGLYHLTQHHQYIDYHIDIHHLSSNSQSEMLYKGIVDKKSRAVFNGRVLIEKDVQKIAAVQTNHNILLSKEAEVYTKPTLEIYADEVQCKHGATVGQLDQEAVFYLCSRGITKSAAINMLLQGFCEDIVDCVRHPAIKKRIQDMVSFI